MCGWVIATVSWLKTRDKCCAGKISKEIYIKHSYNKKWRLNSGIFVMYHIGKIDKDKDTKR